MIEQDSKAAIQSLMARYIDLFNAADFETAVRECYNLPFSWLVGPAIDTTSSSPEFVARMSGMRANLAEQGLKCSELLNCTVRMLSPNAGLAGVTVARHYTDGRPSEVSGGTYVAHSDGNDWRLTSFIAHPIENIIS